MFSVYVCCCMCVKGSYVGNIICIIIPLLGKYYIIVEVYICSHWFISQGFYSLPQVACYLYLQISSGRLRQSTSPSWCSSSSNQRRCFLVLVVLFVLLPLCFGGGGCFAGTCYWPFWKKTRSTNVTSWQSWFTSVVEYLTDLKHHSWQLTVIVAMLNLLEHYQHFLVSN